MFPGPTGKKQRAQMSCFNAFTMKKMRLFFGGGVLSKHRHKTRDDKRCYCEMNENGHNN